jgi:branched-chain amino acid transport system ATP-binding protein
MRKLFKEHFPNKSMILQIDKVTKNFGGLVALKDVCISLREKGVYGLIGPNGSGKTTLFNCISGIYRPTSGSIFFNGKNIVGLKPHQICRLGIGRTFQITRPFLGMTVLENVMVGSIFGRGASVSYEEARSRAEYCIDLLKLSNRKNSLVGNLTLSERKIVEIAKALASQPKLLLLDEVAAGLNPTEVLEIAKLIRRIAEDLGITVFWVEHVMKAIMSYADYIFVLNEGMKIAEGIPQEVANNTRVIESYLGKMLVKG